MRCCRFVSPFTLKCVSGKLIRILLLKLCLGLKIIRLSLFDTAMLAEKGFLYLSLNPGGCLTPGTLSQTTCRLLRRAAMSRVLWQHAGHFSARELEEG